MVEEKYTLEDIEYDKWDDVFDEYNRSKEHFKDLKFDTWYSQQSYYVKESRRIRIEEEFPEELTSDYMDLQYINLGPLMNLLSGIMQCHNDQNEMVEDDEWDPWDESYEEDDETESPPF